MGSFDGWDVDPGESLPNRAVDHSLPLVVIVFCIVLCLSISANIVIVNSRFLEHPQKRSCGNQLIHRHLSKTKFIGSRTDPESQADSQTAMVDGVWS